MMTELELIERLGGIQELLCPGQAHWLYQKAIGLPVSSKILEIGCYHGFSTAAMAMGCLEWGGKVYTIDVCPEHIRIATDHWKRLGLANVIAPVLGTSELVSKDRRLHGPFQFAFIDGDHIGDGPIVDFKNVTKRMAPGGRIAFHDVIATWPDVERAWNDVASKALSCHEFCGSIASGTV